MYWVIKERDDWAGSYAMRGGESRQDRKVATVAGTRMCRRVPGPLF